MLHRGLSGSFGSAPSFGSSARQAFKDFVKLNTPGYDIRSHLGITPSTPRPTSILNSVVKLPAGASSALRLPSFGSSGSTGYYSAPASSGSSAQSLDYLFADLAARYGMDKSTAYQEAMANTGYQRAVADMQQAGLNPASLFGAGKVSPAGGVYGASELPVAIAGSSGFAGSAGSGRGYLFSKEAYGTIANVAGLVGLAATKGNYGGMVAAQSAAKTVMSLANAFFR